MSDIVGSYIFVAMADVGIRKANAKSRGEAFDPKTPKSSFQVLPTTESVFMNYSYNY